RLALRELGYIEGENLSIESRLAQDEGRLRELAAELVRLPVDVLVTRDTTEAPAAKLVTTSTPIGHCSRFRSGRIRARRQPRAAGRERHRRDGPYAWIECEASGATQGDRPWRFPARRPAKPIQSIRCVRVPRNSGR